MYHTELQVLILDSTEILINKFTTELELHYSKVCINFQIIYKLKK